MASEPVRPAARRFLLAALVLGPLAVAAAVSLGDPPPTLTPDQQKQLDDARRLVADAESKPRPEAAAALEKALGLERAVLGAESPRALSTLEKLASARTDLEDF